MLLLSNQGVCWLTSLLLLLLLTRFSRVRLCATPKTAAHRAPPSLGFSRQEHWSVLPFPSPMHESEKWKWSHSVMSDSKGVRMDSSRPPIISVSRQRLIEVSLSQSPGVDKFLCHTPFISKGGLKLLTYLKRINLTSRVVEINVGKI